MNSKIFNILKNDTIRKGSLFTIYSFVNNVISFILLIILAKFLTPEDYGSLNLFNTLITLSSVFICLNTSGYVSVVYFKSLRAYTKNIVGNTLVIASAIYILIISILFFFKDSLSGIIGIGLPFQIMAVTISYLLVIYNLRLDTLRIEERIGSYGKYSISYALSNALLAILLIVGFGYNWLGRAYSYLLVIIIYSILCLCHLLKDNWLASPTNKHGLMTEMLKWGIPLIPHALSFWLRQGADRYIINAYYSAEEVGLYSFMLNISSVIAMVGQAFNATNSVYIYKTLGDDNGEDKFQKLMKHSRMLAAVFFVGTLVYGLICYLFIPLVFQQYGAAVGYLIPLLVSSFFQCIYLLFTNYLFYYSKTKDLMYITLSCSVTQVLLSLLLTRYSLYFTAIASAVASVLTAFFVWFIAIKNLRANSSK